MIRRKVLLIAVGVVLLAVAVVAWDVFKPRQYVTAEQLARVQVGMTVDEVVAVLGHPPGNYTGENGWGLSSIRLTNTQLGRPASEVSLRWYLDLGPASAGWPSGVKKQYAVLFTVFLDKSSRTTMSHEVRWYYDSPSNFNKAKEWVAGAMAKLGL